MEDELLSANKKISELYDIILGMQNNKNQINNQQVQESEAVTKETEWILQKNKKIKTLNTNLNKKNNLSNLKIIQPAPKNKNTMYISDYFPSPKQKFISPLNRKNQNRYQILSPIKQTENSPASDYNSGTPKSLNKKLQIQPTSQKQKKDRPPPIIFSNIKSYSTLNNTLKEKKINYTANMLNNNQIKINVYTEDDYRKITDHANVSNFVMIYNLCELAIRLRGNSCVSNCKI